MLRPLMKIQTRGIAMIVVPAIVAVAGGIMNIYDGLTFLGTTTADASGSWTFAAGLANGTHSFAASETNTAGDTRAASPPVNGSVAPSITSFSATPRARFFIDGTSYQNHAAGKSWS